MIRQTLLYLMLLASFTATANDTVRLLNQKSIRLKPNTVENGYYLVKDQRFIVPFPENEVNFFRFISINNLVNRLSNSSFPYDVKFEKCEFGVYGTPVERFSSATITSRLLYDSCQMNYLILKNVYQNVTIVNSQVRVLVFDSVFNCAIRINSNPLVHVFKLENANNVELDLQFNEHTDSSFVYIGNSTFKKAFVFPGRNSSSYRFVNDTLNGYFSWPIFPIIDSSENIHVFHFDNCYINADMMGFGRFYHIEIEFRDCTFGPTAYLGYLGAQSVKFLNCRIDHTLPLSFSSDSATYALSVVNTDVENLRFNFPENVKLFFDSTYSRDVALSSFSSLLNKYRAEGKTNSYRNIDIQYKEFKNSWFVNLVDRYWWYYGYKKGRVLYWSCFFIFLFTIVNLMLWKQVSSAYPIFMHNRRSYYESINNATKFFLQHYLRVFLFTSFLFFSFNMKFEKLSYDRLRIVSWILVQYIVGIVCFFFILNFVLKLS